MRGPWLMSLGLHAGLFAGINLLAWLNLASIRHHQHLVAAAVQAQQADAHVRAKAHAQQAAVAAAADTLAMELADVAATGGMTPESEAVLSDVDASLADLFRSAGEPSDADLSQARLAALDRTQETAQARLRAELVAQVRAYVRDQVVPGLRERIEQELEHGAGAAVADGVHGAAADGAAHGVSDARLTRAAHQRIDPRLRQAVTDRIVAGAIPEQTQKIVTAVGAELAEAGITAGDFTPLLTKDIHDALTQALAGGVSTEGAWLAAKERAHLPDAGDAGRASAALAAASSALAQLAQRQEQLRESGASDSANQREFAAAAGHAEAVARTALTDAAAVTTDHGALDRALESVQHRTGSQAAAHAAQAMEAHDRSGADHAQQEASHALAAAAAQLSQAASGVAAAATPAIPDAPASAALAAALDRALAPAVGAAASAVDHAGQGALPGPVLGAHLTGQLAHLQALSSAVATARATAATGPGIASSGLSRLPPGGRGGSAAPVMTFNRAVYEAFVKDLRNRTHPGNAYDPVTAAVGLDAVAGPAGPMPAAVWADVLPAAPPAPAPARTLVAPRFHTVAYGAAAMADQPIVVDGDLSDWGPLEHPLLCRWRGDNARQQLPESAGVPVYMRWNNRGLYFGYRVSAPDGIHPTDKTPYNGDCLEVWIDCADSRSDLMQHSTTTHQFCFDPFGYAGDPHSTFVEIGRGQRGLKEYACYVDKTGTRGCAAARRIPGGYEVECFIARTTLARPVLVPGAYLAVNVSVNRGNDNSHEVEWSASKAELDTWNRPDTWGDVLLLGTDAKVRALDSDGQPLTALVPGQILQVEVADADMNLDPSHVDRVLAVVTPEGREGVLAVLTETGPDTGVFRGTLNTALDCEPAAPNTVTVRPGDTVEFGYDDPRAAFGESHRHVGVTVPVAHPILRLAATP